MKKRIDAFRHAFHGLKTAFSEEDHIKIQLIFAIAVIFSGFVFEVSLAEWIILLFCIGLVLGLELMNSAIESLTDLVTREKHPLAGKAKDIAAASVLVASMISAIIGLIIFIPKIFEL